MITTFSGKRLGPRDALLVVIHADECDIVSRIHGPEYPRQREEGVDVFVIHFGDTWIKIEYMIVC